MIKQHISRAEWFAVVASCAAASICAIVWSWRNGAMLNYGDAVAHLHIARRVFDARIPRLTELGSVWLPLPHILMLPFVQIYSWWANGFAGVIPSALAYSAACCGIYRLSRHWLSPIESALALAFFALNPNLLYLQTTAMTEPLFVCEMVWIAVWLVEWRASLEGDTKRTSRLQCLIALVLIASIFTRYDGWIMALVAWTCMGVTLLRRGRLRSTSFWIASIFIIAAPIAWFVYNSVGFGDWLYFARGPYSAKAIELRTMSHGEGPPHPGWHNPWVSLLFFVKVAEMDAVAAAWGNVLLIVSLLGTILAWFTAHIRAFTWALLLWFPIPFYAYSVAYGSVPIFLPPWWPHSWYNTRYGMEMLPAFALGVGFAAHIVLVLVNDFKAREIDARWMRCAEGVLCALIVVNAALMVRERPLTYVEGIKNIEARRQYEKEIPQAFREELTYWPHATILMDTSVFPNLVAFTGIPLRQTINESDLWIFDEALKAPAAHAQLILAFDGDAVDQAVKAHPEGLVIVGQFAAHGQPSATLYRNFDVP
ncbi:MAG TPA: hypothetical protein VGF01_07850 [Terracidiphilus sp.]